MASMEQWHFGKQITLGNLLTGIAAVTAVGLWILDLQERVTVVEYKIDQQVIQTNIVREEVRTLGKQIISKLDGVESRQYRHLEKHAPSSQ